LHTESFGTKAKAFRREIEIKRTKSEDILSN
jgi:predicted GIY-YIG superfamily endonuclease